jgi:hypothetical protein
MPMHSLTSESYPPNFRRDKSSRSSRPGVIVMRFKDPPTAAAAAAAAGGKPMRLVSFVTESKAEGGYTLRVANLTRSCVLNVILYAMSIPVVAEAVEGQDPDTNWRTVICIYHQQKNTVDYPNSNCLSFP